MPGPGLEDQTMELKNKSKVCFWRRVCAGLYKLGDIEVDRRWHNSGPCFGTEMWHVIINGQTIEKHAYLADAKKAAHRLDREFKNKLY
jgi:hypothetical protein